MPPRNLTAEPNQHAITATTYFDAPRALVFKLMHDPALIPQWWGPSSLTTTVAAMEPRAGGSWRYVLRSAKGGQWAFHGVYHAVAAPDRSVFTYEDEGLPGKVSLETYVYEDHEGGTKLTTISVYQSIADRDNMLQSGMEAGADETMDRLKTLLAQQPAA